MNETYEKAGLFYLGKDVDRTNFEPTEMLTLLKNKNFTTHAAIIGMTGSGKTGLGVGIIEEAAIDNIPSIVIDPKGDMGDLCLTDPEFSAASFEPWVADEARAKGLNATELAQKTASFWREGIESWGQDVERVARFDKIEKTIYTPGSSAGVKINLMSSLELPPAAILEDGDNFASYLKSTVTGLLSLIGIVADPLDSKEYILLAQIISKSWMEGRNVTIEELVGRIINPPFDKIGVLSVESFYPDGQRFKFATKFNAVIASPNFANWLSGESLDIQGLLYDDSGKAKISIFSISHLGDDERMFFVTLLLNKYIAWMRMQSGSTRLKTMLYMDEIYGFFPPVKNPPSKEPMITLLKQARAYGVGIVLSTQNPVDLDYKGLSNIGTWCIGRLQTTQDIDRVIDGLGGKVDSTFDKKEIANLLSNLRKRTFFLKSAHLEDIRLFGTRWVMSYLKGPLRKEEISALMAEQKMTAASASRAESNRMEDSDYKSVVTLENSIAQHYEPDPSGANRFRPTLAAKVAVSFYDKSRGIDESSEAFLYLDVSEARSLDWELAETEDADYTMMPHREPSGAGYLPVPSFVQRDSDLRDAKKALSEHLYRNRKLEICRYKAIKLESGVGESEANFKARAQGELDEIKEEKLEVLQDRYGKKEKRLLDRLARANERVEKEKSDRNSSLISVGVSVLGALFGRASLSKVGTSIRRGSRVLKDGADISRAQQRVQEVEEDMHDLEEEISGKIDDLSDEYMLENYEMDRFSITPRRRDVNVEEVVVVWRPDM